MKRGPKPSPDSKKYVINFRINRKQKNKLEGLAKIYTNGDVSDFIRMCVFETMSVGNKK